MNIGNYREDAAFCTPVWKGVEWVPLNALGKTSYTNSEMKEIAGLPVKSRKNCIHNLYEAVQLYLVSGFTGCFDNENNYVNDVLWQKHKTPYQAVQNNTGCCATDTNWLAFFLQDIYPEMGSFCYSNEDGNGHITSYIKDGKNYYFLDMMMCRLDSQKFFRPESGKKCDLIESEWGGYLFRAENPLDFCFFSRECFLEKGRNPPFCFYLRENNSVSATGLKFIEDKAVFYIPNCDNPALVYMENNAKGAIEFVELPVELS